MTENEVINWPINYDELKTQLSCNDLDIKHEEIYSHKKIDNKAFYHSSKRSLLGNVFNFFNLRNKKNIFCYERTTIKEVNFDQKSKKVTSVKLINKSNQTKIINLKGSLILCSGGLGNVSLYKKLVDVVLPTYPVPNKLPIADHPHISLGFIPNDAIPNLKKKVQESEDVEDCILVEGEKNKYAFQISSPYLGDKFFRRLESKFGYSKISYLFLFLINNF